MKGKALTIVLSLLLMASFSFEQLQNISVDQLKKGIQKRLEQRNQILKDYQCEMIAKTISSSPRGDFEMESKFKVYYKYPDNRKVEFIEGKRGDKKISTEDFKRRSGKRGGRGRFGSGLNNRERFDISRYLENMKIIGIENIDGNQAYKVLIEIEDKGDQFKSATAWIDQKTFDVVKVKAKIRPTERLDSGSVTIIFSPIGPKGFWMPTKRESERYMIFDTPMGEMEIESSTSVIFQNYQFNVGLKDELFKN